MSFNTLNLSGNLENITLIPRTTLFGNPVRGIAQISPDGSRIAWSAPSEGVMNLWVAPRDDLSRARLLTQDRARGVHAAYWTYDSQYLLYQQDSDGDENYHLYAISPEGGQPRDLTPFPDIQANLEGLSPRPGLRSTILVSMNRRDPRFADLYRIDVTSGETTLLEENPGFVGFVTDDALQVVMAFENRPDGGTDYFKREAGEWRPWLHLSADDARNTRVSHVDARGENLYMLDSRTRDTTALVSLPLNCVSADEATPLVLFEDPRADISGVLIDVRTYQPLACSVEYERRTLRVLGESLRSDIDLLSHEIEGEWQLLSRSEDDRYWLVWESGDRLPGAVLLFDRHTRRLQTLYVTRPELISMPLARMQSTIIRSRDGLDMVSYLTLPVHVDDPQHALCSLSPVPLVLLVHGGPWARDSYGFNTQHQWLANRGYAVLSVNFRGSTGFGKEYIKKGDGQWGGAMDDDLCDAVDWAIAQGIAVPERIAIMGASYGGYATLWAMTRHPTLYACGIDVVGPSNLETLLANVPSYWESYLSTLHRAVGNPGTPEGLQLLRDRSPLNFATNITRPLLIGQGANDPRVKEAESIQMVETLRHNGIPVTYVRFPDEGHGFARPANSIKFRIITEQFLANYLGGRFEAEHRDEAQGQTAEVETE